MRNIFKLGLFVLFVFVLTNGLKIKQKKTVVNNKNSLFVFGDIGVYNNELKNMVNIAESRKDKNDKIILLGDNFYPDGVASLSDKLWSNYSNTFKNIDKSKIHAVIGNHDYHQDPRPQINNFYWNTPNFYYKVSFDKNIDLFFIDTVQLYDGHCGIYKNKIEKIHGDSIDNLAYKQLNWLQSELEKSNKHKIVFGHYPILSNGYYSSYMEPLYEILYPIFKRYNVKAYVSGHEHNIQYLKKKDREYVFNQFIVGCSSEYRDNEYKKFCFRDMFNDSDNYIINIKSTDNNNLLFDFINSKDNIDYSYTV